MWPRRVFNLKTAKRCREPVTRSRVSYSQPYFRRRCWNRRCLIDNSTRKIKNCWFCWICGELAGQSGSPSEKTLRLLRWWIPIWAAPDCQRKWWASWRYPWRICRKWTAKTCRCASANPIGEAERTAQQIQSYPAAGYRPEHQQTCGSIPWSPGSRPNRSCRNRCWR